MEYFIYFDSRTSAPEVRDALTARFGIDAKRVFAGASDELEHLLVSGAMPFPLVNIFQEPGSRDEFGCRLEAYDDLAEAIGGISDLELAADLCQALDTRALVEAPEPSLSGWRLVTADRWHGPVVLDEQSEQDAGTRLLCAYSAVPSDPSIPVLPVPDWYSGPVPEAGYLPDTA